METEKGDGDVVSPFSLGTLFIGTRFSRLFVCSVVRKPRRLDLVSGISRWQNI